MGTHDIFLPVIFAIVALMLISVLASLTAKLIRIPLPIVLVFFGGLLSQLPQLPSGISVFFNPEVAEEAIIYILLPILIFEAAYCFDVSKFASNGKIIALMAFPGVLFSTLIITLSLMFLASQPLPIALLLGIILSATDPSATIAIFKDSGAPKNLITILEGESLLNDASVIALYKVAVLVLATKFTFGEMLLTTLWQFFWLFGLGAISGWLAGHLLLWLMKVLPDEPYIEISITLITAISCYIGVEKYIQASGIIALTVCGLILAKNTPLPISEESSSYLDSFWHYLSDLSKAVIFILVGIWLDIELIVAHWVTSLLVVVSMLFARSILVYFVLPYFGHLRRHAYILPRSYQHICLWGSLRGAVTLALAMLIVTHSPLFSLAQRETLLAVAMGAVAFTIIVQGLSLEPLAKYLSLADTGLDEAITRKELILSAMKSSKEALSQLIQTPFSDSGAPQEMMLSLKYTLTEQQKELQHLYNAQVGTEGLYKRLIMRGISIEAGYLHLLYEQGIISIDIYQCQRDFLDQQMDAARHKYKQPDNSYTHGHKIKERLLGWLHGKRRGASFRYEMAWSRFLTAEFTLSELDEEFSDQEVNPLIKEHILSIWRSWYQQSEQIIRQLDQLYPQLTAKAQRKWLYHMLKTIHKSHLNKFVRQRLISPAERERIIKELGSITVSHLRNSQ